MIIPLFSVDLWVTRLSSSLMRYMNKFNLIGEVTKIDGFSKQEKAIDTQKVMYIGTLLRLT